MLYLYTHKRPILITKIIYCVLIIIDVKIFKIVDTKNSWRLCRLSEYYSSGETNTTDARSFMCLLCYTNELYSAFSVSIVNSYIDYNMLYV